MSLSVASTIARQGLATTGVAASIASRNIANADNPDAGRKSAGIASDGAAGGVRVVGISVATDTALFERAIETSSARSMAAAMAAGLDRLSALAGDPELGQSPAAALGELRSALQTASGAPHSEIAARAAVEAAHDVVDTLRNGAALVGSVRMDADAAIRAGVAELNGLLEDFGETNDRVVRGTIAGADVTDDVDRRNSLVRGISDLVAVRPMVRGENDMLLFLPAGHTLFESGPRQVIGGSGGNLDPGQPGRTLWIDGGAAVGGDAVGGRLGGLLRLRDELAVAAGQHLDEIARGLVAATAEHDQSPVPGAPPVAGLFTYAGGPALPPAGTLAHGLALTIAVNPTVDPRAAGDVSLLRDGGIGAPGNPAYVYNATGAAGFASRLHGLIEALGEPQPFDAAAGLASGGVGVIGYATQAAGWLEGRRSGIEAGLESSRVLDERMRAAWQHRVGVSLDDEMATLIALQRSYQASTRMLSTVSAMLDALFDATR